MNPVSVLLADDESAMRFSIRAALDMRGFQVREVCSGEAAVHACQQYGPDLVLLDVNMPGIGGVSACRQIRAAHPGVAIVMITVRDGEEDTVRALEAGADDYVIKPFRIKVLLARVDAVLRRSLPESSPDRTVIRAGRLELNLEQRVLRKSGEEIHLSPLEFNLLQYFMQNCEMSLSHSQLLRAIWGPEYGNELEYLRTYVRLLRKKIEENPTNPEYITTEPWLGYRFRVPSLEI